MYFYPILEMEYKVKIQTGIYNESVVKHFVRSFFPYEPGKRYHIDNLKMELI